MLPPRQTTAKAAGQCTANTKNWGLHATDSFLALKCALTEYSVLSPGCWRGFGACSPSSGTPAIPPLPQQTRLVPPHPPPAPKTNTHMACIHACPCYPGTTRRSLLVVTHTVGCARRARGELRLTTKLTNDQHMPSVVPGTLESTVRKIGWAMQSKNHYYSNAPGELGIRAHSPVAECATQLKSPRVNVVDETQENATQKPIMFGPPCDPADVIAACPQQQAGRASCGQCGTMKPTTVIWKGKTNRWTFNRLTRGLE